MWFLSAEKLVKLQASSRDVFCLLHYFHTKASLSFALFSSKSLITKFNPIVLLSLIFNSDPVANLPRWNNHDFCACDQIYSYTLPRILPKLTPPPLFSTSGSPLPCSASPDPSSSGEASACLFNLGL